MQRKEIIETTRLLKLEKVFENHIDRCRICWDAYIHINTFLESKLCEDGKKLYIDYTNEILGQLGG